MILLDTDVMIDLPRQYPPAVAWFGNLGELQTTQSYARS
jgi:hypothetical protein